MVEYGDWHRYNPSPQQLTPYLRKMYAPLYNAGYVMRREIRVGGGVVRYVLCPRIPKVASDDNYGGDPLAIVSSSVELEPFVKLLIGGE